MSEAFRVPVNGIAAAEVRPPPLHVTLCSPAISAESAPDLSLDPTTVNPGGARDTAGSARDTAVAMDPPGAKRLFRDRVKISVIDEGVVVERGGAVLAT
mmetsp:Transcript_33410/g.60366  ORF Transcript_33410/g.60366 Transcript_33410/m.60366 type:complete len:99 (+) Transcript_33410:355-651(+)